MRMPDLCHSDVASARGTNAALVASIMLVVAIMLVSAPARADAQPGVIRGQVVRADERAGLPDAELVLRPSGATTRSDANGYFVFRNVNAGDVDIAARLAGFGRAMIAVRVTELAVTEVEIALQPIAGILNPVVTSATRDSRSLRDIAAAVSVIDSSAIRRDRTVGLHEALRNIPGVQVASRYGTDDANIGIRGSAARARQAVRGAAVLLNGVPITEPDGVARLDLIELAGARQIEVVRGPASALHASSSGGVVNVVLRTGRDSPGFEVRAQGGSFGFRKYDGRTGGLLAAGRGSALATASYTSADGYRAHSDADVLRGHVTFDYLAGADTRITMEATGSSLDSRLPGSLSQRELDATPDAASPSASTFGLGRWDTRYRIGARAEKDFGAGLASSYFFFGGRTLFFPIVSEIVDLNFHRIQGGGRVRAKRVVGLPLDAAAGFDYDNVFGADQRWENNAGARGVRRDFGRLGGAGLGTYGELEWHATKSVAATLGVRYDRVAFRSAGEAPGSSPPQETEFHRTSPRLAVVWRRGDETSLYASAGGGFEVPAFGELSLRPGGPIRSVTSKSLWNYEVGVRRVAGNRVQVEAAAFVAPVRGEFVPVTVGGISIPENASRSRNAGIELAMRALATQWLDVATSYAYLDIRLQEFSSFMLTSTGTREKVDFSGNRMPGVPMHRLTGDVQFRPLDRVDVGVQVEWQSAVVVETGNATSGVWYFQASSGAPVQQVPFMAVPRGSLVHMNAALRIGPGTVFGRVDNLFGRRYVGNVIANERSGRFYEPGSPRSVSLGFSIHHVSKR